ncbi:transmembrane 9 superfamily member 3 [Trichomonascus vanleenenianus]|uniref:Tmn3p n=1 Tax=Trichomonascus vanleenenianus TaxID=2268995 RepID=UPI003ECA53A0
MLFLVSLAWVIYGVSAFYIPGWSIKTYKEGERVPLYVNKVTSDETQLPFAYMDLPFVCQTGAAKRKGLNLGEVLRGDRIYESDYKLEFNQGTQCAELCNAKVTKADLERAHSLVSNAYLVEWIVDNLPGATAFISLDRTKRYYAAGFPLGSIDKNTGAVYLNNHVTLLVRYREDSRDPSRSVIVGFEVYPKSVSNDSQMCPGKSDQYQPFVIDTSKDEDEIRYTYSVYWKQDDSVSWSNRWDLYFSYSEASTKVHWIAIVNSIVIAALMAIVVGVVLIRTLNRDIQAYKQLQGGPDGSKDVEDVVLGDVSGWKLVHGDVFRRPRGWRVLVALVSSGVQVAVMIATVVALACIGVLNPSYRGGMLTFACFMFAFAGVFAGYVNSRLNKDNGHESWSAGVFGTATLVPALVMVVVLGLNMFIWAKASSSALPFGTIAALFCIWLLISCPLIIVGGFFGSKIAGNVPPGRVNAIPRQIPRGGWKIWRRLPFIVLAAGLVPFAVIYGELSFVFKSVWQDKTGYYYMYGFLAAVIVILVVTVCEISILTTYFQLNGEDYHWWWRSFFVGTGSAWWIGFYSIYYFVFKLKVGDFISSLLFFGYSLMGCLVYALLTGTIGFLSSYFFVRRIYSAVKLE